MAEGQVRCWRCGQTGAADRAFCTFCGVPEHPGLAGQRGVGPAGAAPAPNDAEWTLIGRADESDRPTRLAIPALDLPPPPPSPPAASSPPAPSAPAADLVPPPPSPPAPFAPPPPLAPSVNLPPPLPSPPAPSAPAASSRPPPFVPSVNPPPPPLAPAAEPSPASPTAIQQADDGGGGETIVRLVSPPPERGARAPADAPRLGAPPNAPRDGAAPGAGRAAHQDDDLSEVPTVVQRASEIDHAPVADRRLPGPDGAGADTLLRRVELILLDPERRPVPGQLCLAQTAAGRLVLELASPPAVAQRLEDLDWWGCLTRLRRRLERAGWLIACNGARRDARLSAHLLETTDGARVLVPSTDGSGSLVELDTFGLADPALAATIKEQDEYALRGGASGTPRPRPP